MADMSAYNDLESEFKRLSSSLPTRISTVETHESDADKAASDLRAIETDLFQCKQLLGDMEREVRGVRDPTRRELGNTIRQYKEALGQVQKDLDTAKGKFQRNALMSGASAGSIDFNDTSKSQHQRLIDTNTRMASGTDRLEHTRRMLDETEDTAMGISEQLHRDRQVISGIRDKTQQTSGLMDTSRRILRRMSRRECQQKIMMACFALFLLAAIGLIIYFAFVKPKQDKDEGKRRLEVVQEAAATAFRLLRGSTQ